MQKAYYSLLYSTVQKQTKMSRYKSMETTHRKSLSWHPFSIHFSRNLPKNFKLYSEDKEVHSQETVYKQILVVVLMMIFKGGG